MAGQPAGDRYFLIPVLAFAVSLVWLVSLLPRRTALSLGMIAAVGFGVHAAMHWRFERRARRDHGDHPDQSARLGDDPRQALSTVTLTILDSQPDVTQPWSRGSGTRIPSRRRPRRTRSH